MTKKIEKVIGILIVLVVIIGLVLTLGTLAPALVPSTNSVLRLQASL